MVISEMVVELLGMIPSSHQRIVEPFICKFQVGCFMIHKYAFNSYCIVKIYEVSYLQTQEEVLKSVFLQNHHEI